MTKTKKEKSGESSQEDRMLAMKMLWGKRRMRRLNQVVNIQSFCGTMTVREFVLSVIANRSHFPEGLDTPLAIGDFEGNFHTNVLSVGKIERTKKTHVVVLGDTHGGMER